MKKSGDCEHGPSVIVQWCNDSGKRKSSRTKRQSLGPGENAKKKRKSVAAVSIDDVKSGFDEDLLALPQDKALTTDFAFFTVLRLKKGYLTKSGGSRGNCPIGYPGLPCSHCVECPNQRRFYTSADHLRSSFHIFPLIFCHAASPLLSSRQGLKITSPFVTGKMPSSYQEITGFLLIQCGQNFMAKVEEWFQEPKMSMLSKMQVMTTRASPLCLSTLNSTQRMITYTSS